MMSSYSPKQSSRPDAHAARHSVGDRTERSDHRAPTVLDCGQRLAAFLRTVGATNPNAEEDGRARARRIHPRRPLLDRHQPARPGSGPSLLPRPVRLGIRGRDARRIARASTSSAASAAATWRRSASIPEGAPPLAMWNTYIWVDSADETAAKARAAGGAVVIGALRRHGRGADGSLADPEGAVFCVWQAKNHKGAKVVNEHGSLNFNGLATRDPEAAKAFYGAVFGWQTLELPAGVDVDASRLRRSPRGEQSRPPRADGADGRARRLHRRRRRARSDRRGRLRNAGTLERHVRRRRRRRDRDEGTRARR